MTDRRYYVGVDVGTGSARAGIFDREGTCHGTGSHPTALFRPAADFAEHSSDDIFAACGAAIRGALACNGVDASAIAGIGFDATCSLVALDAEDRPVSVSPTGDDTQNVIVWLDHRALAEAAEINAGGHEVLRYVGSTISPEMQTPKLLWLKRHLPHQWQRVARFLDLPDFLTYRATGVDVRSLCTTVCKWTYLGHEPRGGRYDDGFFRRIGLGELVDEGYRRIGTRIRPMGEPIGPLTAAAASELGLAPGIPVAVAIIDAHAGGLGILGTPVSDQARGQTLDQTLNQALDTSALNRRLALIGGTSSCHMAVSPGPRFIPGVWGPYYSAMVPGMWLTEGGQSATGALIDHVIGGHVRHPQLAAEATRLGTTVYALLNQQLDGLARDLPARSLLTRHLHVYPDFHGNRSPLADPTLCGMVSGLRLDDSLDALALLYLATVQAVAHGTRHIVDTLNSAGYAIDTIVVTGGDSKNPLFVEEHANATGCTLVLPQEPEAVLLGAAMLGAVASGDVPDVLTAMARMARAGRCVSPADADVLGFHARKHAVFHRMHADQRAYRELMG